MKNARMTANRTTAGLALLFCLHLLATAPPVVAQGQPSISIEPLELDFGKMEQFEAASAGLIIRNIGDAPLHLGEIETTCGCTAATPPIDILAPGQSTEVTITFNSQKFQGEQIKYVKVHSSDPFHSLIDVAIRADVHAALAIMPPTDIITFRKLPVGVTQAETLSFSTEDVAVLTIEPARFRPELFDVTIEDAASGDPREKTVVIAVRPDAPLGTFREIVSFDTNVPKRTSVNIEVGGAVVAPVVLDPEQVNLRYLQRNEVVSHIFTVRIQRGFDIGVTGAEIDLPGFKVKDIQPNPAINAVAVTIEGTPLPISDERAVSARGRMKGMLRVFTDHPDYPELSASVMYLLKL
ncbi:DUF1573 domain-containing protein [bacterium]|nr:DUF1573 domain-containing protein [bacterium]MBU1072310.1 DUF1573 domain-containing protein [bacterium]MBU1677089.1 DUF1573 domain-containing protein [bacterium]